MEERYQSDWDPPAPLPQRWKAPLRTTSLIGEKGGKHEVAINTLGMWALNGGITPANQVDSSVPESWAVAGQLSELTDVFGAAQSAFSSAAKPKRSGVAGFLAVIGLVALFIYQPIGILHLFVALVVKVVF